MLSHENLSFILYRVHFILCRVNVLKSTSLCFYFSRLHPADVLAVLQVLWYYSLFYDRCISGDF